jgi:ribose/xylose/arabinose/galactoside ABC-type transport system permease subunit
VLNRGAPVALLALGMVLVIATRGIDLSVGAVMAISGAIAASLADAHGLPLALAAALGASALPAGCGTAFLVAVLGIQPIVATLILMVAGRGIAQLITEGRIVTFTAPDLVWLGNGAVLGVPAPVVIVLGMLIVTGAGPRHGARPADRGDRRQRRASELAGIGTRGMILAVYVWCGLCAALAGVIAAADIMGADANNAGLWLELDAILAVVIGGTSLFGGRFSLVLAMVGALIIQAMNTGILLSGYPPEFNLVVKAAVVLIGSAAAVAALRRPSGPCWGGPANELACRRCDHHHRLRRRICTLHGAISQFRLDPRVIANLLTDNAFLGIVATGMTFVIISGGIDLSVGSVIGFTTVFLARRSSASDAAAGRLRAILLSVRRLRRGDGRHHPLSSTCRPSSSRWRACSWRAAPAF